MNPMEVFTAIVAIFALGLIIFETVKLTIEIIKKIRKNKNTKVIVGDMKDFIRQVANDPNAKSIKFSDLDKYSSYTAEINTKGEVVGEIKIYEEHDHAVQNLLKDAKESYVVIED